MKFGWQQLSLYLSPSEFTKVKEVTNEIDTSQTSTNQIKYYDVWLSSWHRIEPSTYFDRVPQINQNNRIYYAPSGFYVGIAFRYWLVRICEANVDSDGNVTYTWKFTECNRSDKKKILDELMGTQPIVSVKYQPRNTHTYNYKYADAYLMNTVDPSIDIGEIPAFCLPNGYAKTDFASGVFTPAEYFTRYKDLNNVPIIGNIRAYNFNNFDYGEDDNPSIISNVFTGDTVDQDVFSVIPLYGVSLQLYMPMVTEIDLLETDTASYNQLFDRTLIAIYSNYGQTYDGSGSSNGQPDSGEKMLGGCYEIVIYPILAPNQTATGGDTSGQQDNNTI